MCRLSVGGWRLPVYYSAVFPGRTRDRLPHRRAAALEGGLDPQGPVPRGYGIAPPEGLSPRKLTVLPGVQTAVRIRPPQQEIDARG